MKLDFVVCAQASSIDISTNQLSIFNIFTDIIVAGFPISLRMETVLNFRRDSSEPMKHDVSMLIKHSNHRNPLAKHNASIDFQGKNTTRLIGKLESLTITGPGTVTVSVRHNSRKIGETSFLVVQPSGGTITFSDPRSSAATSGKDTGTEPKVTVRKRVYKTRLR